MVIFPKDKLQVQQVHQQLFQHEQFIQANNRSPIGIEIPQHHIQVVHHHEIIQQQHTSPPPSYPTNSTGNYSQQSNNKMTKKPKRSNDLHLLFYLFNTFYLR